MLPPVEKVVMELEVSKYNDRTPVQSRPNGILEAPLPSLHQKCDDRKGFEDSGRRKHTPCNTALQPCGFWDWLSPTKCKDALGNTSGQEGYDPTSVLIPKQYYDEMTG
jgi:hypothetical protein